MIFHQIAPRNLFSFAQLEVDTALDPRSEIKHPHRLSAAVRVVLQLNDGYRASHVKRKRAARLEIAPTLTCFSMKVAGFIQPLIPVT